MRRPAPARCRCRRAWSSRPRSRRTCPAFRMDRRARLPTCRSARSVRRRSRTPRDHGNSATARIGRPCRRVLSSDPPYMRNREVDSAGRRRSPTRQCRHIRRRSRCFRNSMDARILAAPGKARRPRSWSRTRPHDLCLRTRAGRVRGTCRRRWGASGRRKGARKPHQARLASIRRGSRYGSTGLPEWRSVTR